MQIKGNAYAALVTHIEKLLDLDGKTRFLTFPQFLVRLDLKDLLFDVHDVMEHTGIVLDEIAQKEAVLNLESFALTVNQIPECDSTFSFDGRMLWSVLNRVLLTRELATGGNPDDLLHTDQLFTRLNGHFASAEHGSSQIGGGSFWATTILPPNELTDSDGWTRIALDHERIDQISEQTSPAIQSWLEQLGLLDQIERNGVKTTSLSAEVFVLTLFRDWFDPEVFQNRRWKWADAPLSDGGDPPNGQLPAYVTRVVLVRKLEVELDVASDTFPDDVLPEHDLSGNTGFAVSNVLLNFPVATSANLHSNNVALHLNHAEIASTVTVNNAASITRPMTLREFAKIEVEGNNNALAFEIPVNFSAGFPAAVTFRCARVLETIKREIIHSESEVVRLMEERNAAQSQVLNRQQELARAEHQLNSYPPNADTVTVNDHTTHPMTTTVIDVAALRAHVASLKHVYQIEVEKLRKLELAKAALVKRGEDLQELHNQYERLSTGDHSDIFILGFACSTVPLSPNPDLQLFS